MINKIISGGQTGADQAALDVAIKYHIPHGGWIPKGRLTEEGPLPAKYQLMEMDTDSYPARTEQNVMDSDGTVIFSRGKLQGGSEYTQEMARKHHKPCMHIDLDGNVGTETISGIHSWIIENHIDILNVAGPRASKDASIYENVTDIISGVVFLRVMNAESGTSVNDYSLEGSLDDFPMPPGTVDEAVDRLIKDLPLTEKTVISKMAKEDLVSLHLSLGNYITNEFNLWEGNDELLESCRSLSGIKALDTDRVPYVIIEYLWIRLNA